MSLRDKAREVKAAGVAERGNFTPTGAPLRAYKYWAKHSNNVPARDNFCHFWRVVVFWAPFMAFRRAVSSMAESPVFWVILAVIVAAVLLFSGLTWHGFGIVTLVVLALLYATAGIMAGIIMEDEMDDDMPVNSIFKWFFWLTIPTSGITYVMITVFNRLDKSTKDAILPVIIFAIVFAYIVFFTVQAFLAIGFWIFLIYLGILVGIALAVGLVIALGALFQALRAAKAKRNAYKPMPVDDDYLDGFHDEETKVREPGRLSKFFTSIADFLILATQIVRVNKWKICPLVDIK